MTREEFRRVAALRFSHAASEKALRAAILWAQTTCPPGEHPYPHLFRHARIFPAPLFAPLFEAASYLKALDDNPCATPEALDDVVAALAARATRESRPVTAAAVALARMAAGGRINADCRSKEALFGGAEVRAPGHEDICCYLAEALAEVRDLTQPELLRLARATHGDHTLALRMSRHAAADVAVWQVLVGAVRHERLALYLAIHPDARADETLRRYLLQQSAASPRLSALLAADAVPGEFPRLLARLIRDDADAAANVLRTIETLPPLPSHLLRRALSSPHAPLRTEVLTRLRAFRSAERAWVDAHPERAKSQRRRTFG